MDSKKPDIDELLSGMLDGRLSIAESKILEAELAKHPERNVDLDQLAAIRSSLLRGRPTGKLGEGFASKVAAAARARAETMGSETPEWLQSDRPREQTDQLKPDYLKRFWFAASTVGVVAAVTVLFVGLMVFVEKPQDLGYPIAQIPTGDDHKATDTEPTLNPMDADETRADEPKTMVAEARETTQSDTKSEALLGPETKIASSDGTLMDSQSMSSSPVVATNTIAESSSKTEVEASPKPEKPMNPTLDNFGLMMVVDVSIDQKARDRKVLEFLLEKNGFGGISDLPVEDVKTLSLLDAGLVGPIDPTGTVQCLAIKGSARMVENLRLDLEASYEDFPQVAIDVLIATEEVEAVSRNLEDVFVDESAGSTRRLGRATSQGFVSRFSPNLTRDPMFMSIEERRQKAKEQKAAERREILEEPGSDLNPISVVLLLVRSSSE